MAVLTTTTIKFEGQDFKRQVRILKDGLFRIRLPAVVSKTLQIDSDVIAETKEEVERAFKDRLREYKECRTTTRKVILFGFAANCHIMNEKQTQAVYVANDISFADGTALSFWAEVCEETVIGRSDGKDQYRYDIVDSDLPLGFGKPNDYDLGNRQDSFHRASNLVEWTSEREIAVAEFCRMLQVLILKLRDALRLPKQLMELIDGGRLLMWGGTNEKEVV